MSAVSGGGSNFHFDVKPSGTRADISSKEIGGKIENVRIHTGLSGRIRSAVGNAIAVKGDDGATYYVNKASLEHRTPQNVQIDKDHTKWVSNILSSLKPPPSQFARPAAYLREKDRLVDEAAQNLFALIGDAHRAEDPNRADAYKKQSEALNKWQKLSDKNNPPDVLMKEIVDSGALAYVQRSIERKNAREALQKMSPDDAVRLKTQAEIFKTEVNKRANAITALNPTYKNDDAATAYNNAGRDQMIERRKARFVDDMVLFATEKRNVSNNIRFQETLDHAVSALIGDDLAIDFLLANGVIKKEE